jgi:hypothetical protein
MHAHSDSHAPFGELANHKGPIAPGSGIPLLCPATRRHFMTAAAALAGSRTLIDCPYCSEMHVWNPQRRILTRFAASAACG